MTGEADVLPPLCGEDTPGLASHYACAFLTGDDVEPPVFSPAYLRLLLVYNRRGFTALRKYSSDTNSWGPEAKADVRISDEWLRNMVQPAAHCAPRRGLLASSLARARGAPRRHYDGVVHAVLRISSADTCEI
jgi:hypothetical protein